MFVGEIFQTQTQTIEGCSNPTQPEPQKIDPSQVKNFWPGPITSNDVLHLQKESYIVIIFSEYL